MAWNRLGNRCAGGALVALGALFASAAAAAPWVSDSYQLIDRGRALVFYIERINGEPTKHAEAHRDLNRGGLAVEVLSRERALPEGELRLQLVAEQGVAAPILLIGHTIARASGELRFTPQPHRRYVVRGELRGEQAFVWLEDADGRRVGELLPSAANAEQPAPESPVATGEAPGLSPRAAQLMALPLGAGREFVRAALGGPEQEQVQKGRWFPTPRPAITTWIYPGLGEVQFRSVADGGLNLDQVALAIVAQSDPVAAARVLLADADAERVRASAKQLFGEGVRDPAMLDLFAQIIWTQARSSSAAMIDAMAFLCKAIGASGNPRYRTFLAAAAERGRGSKLRRHALDSLELLANEPVPQFAPELAERERAAE